MFKEFEVRWEGFYDASPEAVWDAITVHTDGWLWKVEYEPWIGGAERGVTVGGGSVTAWEPHRHFATRTRPETERDGMNALDFVLEPRGGGTVLRYAHNGVLPEDVYDAELDCCRQHTAFYKHSLGVYAQFFAFRAPGYVSVDAAPGVTFVDVRRALGLPDDVATGDNVTFTPEGLEQIEGVADWVTPAFLGVRAEDALYRVYGRDAWGHQVGIAHHLFDAPEQDWAGWLAGLTTKAVA